MTYLKAAALNISVLASAAGAATVTTLGFVTSITEDLAIYGMHDLIKYKQIKKIMQLN